MSSVVGYSGSADPVKYPDPSYQNIHDYAECIRLTFDTEKTSYVNMLEMFFAFHDAAPRSLTGSQYRSAIFFHTAEQEELARAALDSRGRLGDFVGLEPANQFYRAEEYHQKYMAKSMRW